MATNSRQRYGPTASSSSTSSPRIDGSSSKAGFSAPLANGLEDDDDLDDHLHTFTAAEKRDLTSPFDITSIRGWANALTLAFLAAAVLLLFAGYPIITYYGNTSAGAATSGYNLGGINASGQYPDLPGFPTLIDPDTPESAYSRVGHDGNTWTLSFSDEFNKEGRTFFEGDDPFFQAMDYHYWPTGDLEWYDPSAVTTKDGHLLITMTQEIIHDLNLKSGMIQSWNKLCFNKNAYFEVSASFPGQPTVGGFWPGVWTMGNLGRPGYGATTDGVWPYTYDSCDVGTLANQTDPDGLGPIAALTTGAGGGPLSFLPGQRCSACTCPGEDHPGPSVDVGRASPEIDMIEAQILLSEGVGQSSQSFQIAPYDDYYQFDNTSTSCTIYDPDVTSFNTYLGGVYQQAVSCLTKVDREMYWESSQEFRTSGFEFFSNVDDRSSGYITWYSQGVESWTMRASAVGPNPRTEVGQRIVSEEPMAMIFNLAASNNFQLVDIANMNFPNYMRIDYVRVYQLPSGTIGCDPDDHPTADYIARHSNAYNNPNLTTWEAAGNTFPKNRLKDTC